MVVKLTGVITQALPPQYGVSQRTGNQWASQEYVMQHDNGQFEKYVSFRVMGQEKIAQFNIQVGQYITVCLDINAHEYNGRWYNEISAFKIEYPGVQQQMPQQMQPQQMPPVQGGMPPQQMPPQAQGCQVHNQYGANQMPYNVPQQAPQQQMPPQAPQQMPQQQMPTQQQVPFPPQR